MRPKAREKCLTGCWVNPSRTTRKVSGFTTREGKSEDAIAAFDRALEIEPSHTYAWHDRGVCLRALERNEEALASITKALELAPAEEEILFTCGATLQKLGILRDDSRILSAAADTYNQLLEKNPANADAWNNLGICVQAMGRDDLSRQYFERAKDLKRYNTGSGNATSIP